MSDIRLVGCPRCKAALMVEGEKMCESCAKIEAMTPEERKRWDKSCSDFYRMINS